MTSQNNQIPAGYKQTDVGVIPNSWKTLQIRDIAKYRRGSFPQPYGLPQWYDDIGGMPFIQVVDVGDNCRLKKNTKQRLSKKAEKYSVFVKKGSLIVTIQGSIGRVAVTNYDAFMDRTLLLFESFNIPVDVHFLKYALQVLFEKEKQSAPGGIIKTITKEALSSFVLQVPAIGEQSLISKALSDIDSLISKLDQLIQKKKNIKQGAMQELLTGKRRLPGFSGEWKEIKIEDIFRVTRGLVLSMKKTTPLPTVKNKYPVYSSQTLHNGLAGYYSEYLFEDCITWTTDGANAGDVKYRHGKFYCTNVCGVLESHDQQANSCIAAIFNSVSRKYVSYVGNPKLMNNVVAQIRLKIPGDVEEQKSISKIIDDLENEMLILETRKNKYQDLKQGMMQQLLTGKIRLV